MSPCCTTRCLRSHLGLLFLTFLLALSTRIAAQEKPQCTLPDCDQAKAFFVKFQQAVDANRKQDVAGMVRYPLHSYSNGRASIFKTKDQLLAGYDSVFTPGLLCTIKIATQADVWGNWRGFTITGGAIWWDRIVPNSATKDSAIQPPDLAKYPFGVFGVNHSTLTDKDCTGTGNAKAPNQ